MLRSKFQEIINKLKKENNHYKLTPQESIEINNKINSEMQEVRRDFRKRSFESELAASKIIINT
jgi:hypothetical protein